MKEHEIREGFSKEKSSTGAQRKGLLIQNKREEKTPMNGKKRVMIAILLTFAAGSSHKGAAVSDFAGVYQAGFQLALDF